MSSLNEKNVEKKFSSVSGHQQSIQSIALWVITHKTHSKEIVQLWLKVLKQSALSHRLTMFYLCNEIVQTCKRKRALMYREFYKEVLPEAVLLVNDGEIKSKIERIFDIWDQRRIYDAAYIAELKDIINSPSQVVPSSKQLADFQPKSTRDMIIGFQTLETANEIRRQELLQNGIQVTNIDIMKQMKEKTTSPESIKQYEDACIVMEDYSNELGQEIEQRKALVQVLEQSELYYESQYGEAKIVANAYKNFGLRITNLKKKLKELKGNLSSPVPSPPQDAPSPEASPIRNEGSCGDDMEMSDEECSKNEVMKVVRMAGTSISAKFDKISGAKNDYNPEDKNAPYIPDGLVSPVGSPIEETASEERTKQMVWNPTKGLTTEETSSSTVTIDRALVSQVTPVNVEGNQTPTKDERPCTPTLDEPPEILAAATKSSGMDFLSNLISGAPIHASSNALQSPALPMVAPPMPPSLSSFSRPPLPSWDLPVQPPSASRAPLKNAAPPPPPPPPSDVDDFRIKLKAKADSNAGGAEDMDIDMDDAHEILDQELAAFQASKMRSPVSPNAPRVSTPEKISTISTVALSRNDENPYLAKVNAEPNWGEDGWNSNAPRHAEQARGRGNFKGSFNQGNSPINNFSNSKTFTDKYGNSRGYGFFPRNSDQRENFRGAHAVGGRGGRGNFNRGRPFDRPFQRF